MKKIYNIVASYGNDNCCETDIYFEKEEDAKLFCEVFEKTINKFAYKYADKDDKEILKYNHHYDINKEEYDEDIMSNANVSFYYTEGYKYDNALDFFKNNNFDKCLEFARFHTSFGDFEEEWEKMSQTKKQKQLSIFEKLVNELEKAEAKKQKENKDELSM